MSEISFKKWNNILGWLCFISAVIIYGLTAEPTVSFWDSGEYILSASKLNVGHPPGAPLFQMLGAFFSIFAIEQSQIGFIMNLMSGVASAFTVLFMFWSISILLSKISSSLKSKTDNYLTILISSFIASLSFIFTDTFWFNAVETEVYAMATLIMSLLFYLGLRWEQEMHLPKGNRWLILISFVVGLSFGVHFMGLLTIPAIGLIYFFKNYKPITIKKFILANVVVVGILMFVFKLLAPNVLRYFSVLEVFFVNSVGLPFNSGTVIAGILLVTFFYYLLNYTIKNNLKTLNTVSLCVLFILIGFSSWIMLPIRANSDVVINENDPADARQLLAYYNLEQYPKTHLFYGPLFTDQYSGLDEENPYKDDKPKYEKDLTQNKYVIVNNYKNASQNFNSEHASILPRMWSSEHASNYLRYTGFLDYEVKKKYRNQAEAKELIDLVNDFKTRTYQGDVDYEEHHKFLKNYGTYLDIEKPSLISNVKYLIQYQLGYMYWRYFMWNFSGRQDDIQGRMDMHGNWISGLDFIDEIHLGLSQENLPSDVAENKSRNKYYMIPFIIGLIGLYFLYNKDKELFWTMLVFFIFTGIAIQVYTNVRPFEPRERDYSVVGSFYVYCIWIGFGIFSLILSAEHFINSKYTKLLTIPVFLLILPINLASSNWDDHDRSGRYTARSMAIKYLESCEPNSILFTIGDNDTFPLWYLQEIEGVRTDVRVLNTSLFNTDWYIDQMKRKAYESDPIPSSISHDKYRYGTRDYIIKEVTTLDTIDIKTFIKFVTQDDDKYKYKSLLQKQGYETNYMREQDLNANYLPSESIRIPVDKESVLKNNIVDNNLSDEIVDEIIIKIKGQALYKNRLMMLDIIAENNWERPIYFTGGSFGDDDYLWMKDYLQLEGLCYKLVPIKTTIDQTNPYEMGRVNTEKMYSMVKDWDWGTNGDMDIYFDVESRKNSITYRSNIARLINQLILENKKVKAEEITDIVIENMPVNIFGYYTLLESYIESYYKLENKEKARGLFSEIANKYKENLFYFSSLKDENKNRYAEEIYTDIERYRSLVGVIISYEEGKFLEKQMEDFNYYLELFIGKEE
ncbi:DUF2723 domain-containing protein [Flavobacteriaceae bacterium]|nr:DUF2723 domain-containing protein [Flavobacteriaceae bacterium]MDC1321160.1 DUF2723 domain-containing protein [Flavobacteriaceae bacterium]